MNHRSVADRTAMSQENAAPSKGFHIPSLDGIRGISVMIVFFAHAGLEKIIPGGFGVTIFFFLSGYLITTLLRLEFAKNGKISLPNFYMRRALRIFPPLYLTVIVSVILGLAGLLHDRWNWEGVFGNFAFLTNYMGNWDWVGSPGTGPMWSLAVEEHFYLIFPAVFAFGLAKMLPKNRGIALLAFCALTLGWRLVQAYYLGYANVPQGFDPRMYVATDSRLDNIVFGCILALWGNPMIDEDAKARPMPWVWIGVGFAGLIAMLVLFRGDNAFRHSWRYTIQGLCLIPVFSGAIGRHKEIPFRWLNAKWLRWVGLMSYTIYLVHLIGFDLVEEHITKSFMPKLLITMPLVLLYAWLMYRLVEKPMASLRKRYN
ncbi:MAG: acyltransferase [Armatimonadetes bacterium]|nr:acyltransferase [Armatimonadota bacterium]